MLGMKNPGMKKLGMKNLGVQNQDRVGKTGYESDVMKYQGEVSYTSTITYQQSM